MPSDSPNIATVENVSEVDRESTPRQGSASPAEPSMITGDVGPQAPQPDDYLHEHHTVQEQKMSENDPTHSPSQGNTEPNPRLSSNPPFELPLPKLSDPLKTHIPKPDGDPFEHVLKSMLEEDTVQCNAWKDEVQNILIFAGLFSAVVTAFIIESYQRLQPDPNDAIVGLLAHIAEKLDNLSISGTASVSSIVADTNFSASRSDVNINIFWFISLVLSLTTALIGIITLQWLREHQRYDNTLKPRETMAILNARLHSLTQWYVPQIFAGLPLLLQGAIILFFAGMIEFLFALSLKVAVPVMLSICIPLLFLIATTLLPVLQVCILQDPFRLSINNDVPSPCPYKSPQSLIARRFSTASGIAFTCLASMVAGVYVCVIQISCFVRNLRGRHWQLPIFRTQRPNLKLRLRNSFPRSIRKSLPASGDWTSIDRTWLDIRSTYAVSLQLAHRYNDDLIADRIQETVLYDVPSKVPEGLPTGLVEEWRHTMPLPIIQSLLPEVFDCTHAIVRVLDQVQANTEIGSAAYHCLVALCSEPFERRRFHFSLGIISAKHNRSAAMLLHLSDLCVAFGRLLFYSTRGSDGYLHGGATLPAPVSAAFVKEVVNNEPSRAAETLGAAFMTSLEQNLGVLTDIQRDWSLRLVASRLEISALRLFSMSNSASLLPDIGGLTFSLSSAYSQSITNLYLVFLETCLRMKPSSENFTHPAPTRKTYGALGHYTKIIVQNQDENRIADTLAHLTLLCNSNQDIIQEEPFLLMAACMYLHAAAFDGHVGKDEPLLKLILTACGIENDLCHQYLGWDGLDDAIDIVYHHHNPPQTVHLAAPSLNQSDSAASLANPNGHDIV